MAAVADQNGVVRGVFNIPAGVPAGTKSVIFQGEGGSRGQASYTGSHTIRTELLRRVTTVTEQRYDPLAQTFTLEQSRLIAAVDVWVKTKGTEPLRCQVRETTLGIPNQVIIAEAELRADELKLAPTATRFSFAPVALEAGREYALVFLTDDANHELAIAELGKFSADTNQWQTRQPYQVGVLLSSSNAVTWTPHQDKDLRFRLFAAKFTQTQKDVQLGTVTLGSATDLLPMAGVERPSAETDVQFIVTDAAGKEYTTQEDLPLNLASAVSNDVTVKARLRGTSWLSPVLHQGVQLVSGNQAVSGTYVTNAFPGGNNAKLNVTFEALLPSGSSVKVEAQINGAWTELQLDGSTPVDNGRLERRYSLSGFTSAAVRVRLTLTGTAASRPRIRRLRAVTT